MVEAGWYVSFAGTVTFRNAPGLRPPAPSSPLDRMVLETDSPFLSPHPYRGRPNHPAGSGHRPDRGRLHGVGVERVAEATTATAAEAFAWPWTAVADAAAGPADPGTGTGAAARHDLRPSKALGQHYLADPNTARKVARLGGIEPGETVLEVGPGLGSLTLALRQAGAAVVAVEADPRLLPALAEVAG